MDAIKSWTTHIEFVVIFMTLLGGFYSIDSKIDRQSHRTDTLYEIVITTLGEIKQNHGRLCTLEERTR